MKRYAVVIEKADGNYSAYVPDLPGCVATGSDGGSDRGRDPRRPSASTSRVSGRRLEVPEPTSIAEYVEASEAQADRLPRHAGGEVGHPRRSSRSSWCRTASARTASLAISTSIRRASMTLSMAGRRSRPPSRFGWKVLRHDAGAVAQSAVRLRSAARGEPANGPGSSLGAVLAWGDDGPHHSIDPPRPIDRNQHSVIRLRATKRGGFQMSAARLEWL